MNLDMPYSSASGNIAHRCFAICNNQILCRSSSNGDETYLISMTNNDDFIKLTFPDGKTLSNISFPCVVGNKIWVRLSDRQAILDTETKEVRYKNWNRYPHSYNSTAYRMLKVEGTHYFIFECQQGSYDPRKLSIFIDPTFLITINNLENPVTKTSAQTMKVTYVLSPA